MKKTLFYMALAGWVLSITVNLLILADSDLANKLPFVLVLNILIFIVWIPTILELRKNKELRELQQPRKLNQTNPFKFFNIILRDTPKWLKIITIGCFFYAFLSFVLFIFSQKGSVSMENGQYILQDHGQLIKTLTEQEYHHFKANELRGFSGIWLFLYGIATTVLFPYKKKSIYS